MIKLTKEEFLERFVVKGGKVYVKRAPFKKNRVVLGKKDRMCKIGEKVYGVKCEGGITTFYRGVYCGSYYCVNKNFSGTWLNVRYLVRCDNDAKVRSFGYVIKRDELPYQANIRTRTYLRIHKPGETFVVEKENAEKTLKKMVIFREYPLVVKTYQ